MKSSGPRDHPPLPFSFSLKRSTRRKTAAIQVYPDGRVIVSAPGKVSDEKIHEFLFQKKAWVMKTLQKIEAIGPKKPQTQFNSGDFFFHQGKQKELQIHDCSQASVHTDHDFIHVYLSKAPEKKSLQKRVQTLLELWFKREALRLCQERCSYFSNQMSCTPKNILIKAYKSRWGTCKSNGEITFNWRLAMAPSSVLDYVVVHELAHLKFHHHGPLFWKWVKIFYPEPNRAKKELQIRDQKGELSL